MPEARSWRVVLSRVPASADAHAVVDALGGPTKEAPPRVLGSPMSWAAATELLEELHTVGVEAAVIPDESACRFHPAYLVGGVCTVCANPTCAECRAGAGGASVCPNCHLKAERIRRAKRLRQLFSVFLFSVFLFSVASYLRGEAAALKPPVAVLIVQLAPERLLSSPAVHKMNEPDGGAGRSLRLPPFGCYAVRRTVPHAL